MEVQRLCNYSLGQEDTQTGTEWEVCCPNPVSVDCVRLSRAHV